MLKVKGLLASVLTITPLAAAASPLGTLVSAEPVRETPGGMKAWKIRYWTTSDRGTEIEVTGMVIAPREVIPAAPR